MEDVMTTVATPINRIKEFYSKERDYSGFYKEDFGVDADIEKKTKEIKKSQELVYNLQDELNKLYSRKYAKKYDPIGNKALLKYESRSGESMYFSIPDGQLIDISCLREGTYNVYPLSTKSGETGIVAGYCYDLGSIIIKYYKYSINSTNNRCNLHLLYEELKGFLEEESACSNDTAKETSRRHMYYYSDPMRCVNCGEFVNELFGTSRDLKDISLRDACSLYKNNKAFEIILKTAPDELLKTMLHENYETTAPIHKLLGLDNVTYLEALAEGVIIQTKDLAWAIKEKEIFNKTPNEWMELIRKCKKYEKDLQFYGIDYNLYHWGLAHSHFANEALLLSGLASWYASCEELNKNYSFGKFVDYVIKESIDQGFSTIKSYVSTLIDYLRMCEQNRIKPTLFSSQLDMTHNIAKRNNKITVSYEDEQTFASRYATFVPWKKSGYMIIAPKNTHEVKQEGDELDHCVASYIKRVIDNECLIYFLRQKEDESELTVEIENGAIVQARGIHNRFPNDVETLMLNKFAKERGYKCCYNEVEELPDEEEEDEDEE